jgi:hypothetical protein
VQELLGSPTFFDASLPACHGLRTPADLAILANTDGRVLPSVCVKTLGVRNKRLFEAVPALQGARSPLRPPGYAVDASSILFAVSPRLRHGRKTRYGWMAHPYPTGTFTLQETPSLSWRDNAGAQALPEAGAQRTLEAVGCSALFGPHAAAQPYNGKELLSVSGVPPLPSGDTPTTPMALRITVHAGPSAAARFPSVRLRYVTAVTPIRSVGR